MIYLGFSSSWGVSFALYNGIMIKCVETDTSWQFIHGLADRAARMCATEQRQAHHLPECRDVAWSLKFPYTRRVWRDLNHYGVVVNQPAEAMA